MCSVNQSYSKIPKNHEKQQLQKILHNFWNWSIIIYTLLLLVEFNVEFINKITWKYNLEIYCFCSSIYLEIRNKRNSCPEVFCKKVLLEISQNPQENTCARVPFLIKMQAETCNFLKNETLAQVFFCEFCEISKNTFPYRTPQLAASRTIRWAQIKFT